MIVQNYSYKGWPNCVRLKNESLELVVSTDFGPRVLYLGLPGGENIFHENPDQAGMVGGKEWRSVAGHRFWHAPEDLQRTYLPDNDPLTFEDHGEFVRLIQPVESATGIQKEIDISLPDEKPRVEVTHRLTNCGLWGIRLAPWAISVMRGEGMAILPLPPYRTHDEQLTPNNTLSLWAYTDMADPRWTWGSRCLILRQDSALKHPQKIGIRNTLGWIGYLRETTLFTIQTNNYPGREYPDLGCSVEVYTDGDMLELETLGPMVDLEPGQNTEHRETWRLFGGVPAPQTEQEILNTIFPLGGA